MYLCRYSSHHSLAACARYQGDIEMWESGEARGARLSSLLMLARLSISGMTLTAFSDESRNVDVSKRNSDMETYCG